MSVHGWSSRRNALRLVLLAALAVPVSVGAGALSIPATWLVGPLLVAVVLGLASPGLRPVIPTWFRTSAQAVIGVVLASGFRPETLPLLAREWLPVTLAVAGTLGLSMMSGILLSRFTSLDRKTAMVGALPGAASGMLAMSESVGADPRVVAVMQYGRVILVVLSATAVARFTSGAPSPSPPAPASDALLQSLPVVYLLGIAVAAVGAFVGLRSRLPAGALLGPLILGVIIEEAGLVSLSVPPVVSQAAFATIGAYAGLLFDRESVVRVAGLLPWILLSNVLLMVACTGLGVALALLIGTDTLTAYLSTTPGGIDSVAVLALGSNADVSTVTAIQTLRVFAVIVAGAILGKALSDGTNLR